MFRLIKTLNQISNTTPNTRKPPTFLSSPDEVIEVESETNNVMKVVDPQQKVINDTDTSNSFPDERITLDKVDETNYLNMKR